MGKFASFASRPSLTKREKMTQMTVMTQNCSPVTSLTAASQRRHKQGEASFGARIAQNNR
jgi:hypothetical protein